MFYSEVFSDNHCVNMESVSNVSEGVSICNSRRWCRDMSTWIQEADMTCIASTPGDGNLSNTVEESHIDMADHLIAHSHRESFKLCIVGFKAKSGIMLLFS
jgi:Ni,Fe-hydrogenase I small subunit